MFYRNVLLGREVAAKHQKNNRHKGYDIMKARGNGRTVFPGAAVISIALAAQVLLSSLALAEPFQGKIAPYGGDAESWWPEEERAPAGAPNILVWMMDDVGFGHLGSYGGLIETPNIDKVAERGLRYTNFHTTAICSPSRASFLAGRNPHAIGIGGHAAGPSGFPGYYGKVPKSAAGLAKVLQQNHYSTYALGKWDQLPNQHVSPVGPFDYWPSGQGFDRFYGFLAAETSNFEPVIWSDHTPVDPAVDKEDYHLSTDMADKAIKWITTQRSVAPQRPFFMYWATGAVHSPHHAPENYIEKYQGKFDMGWDKAREQILARQKELGIVPDGTQLPPRPDDLPAWDSLSVEEKRMHARTMEVMAAQLEHADYEFGRMLETLERTGYLDNTIVLITSDNGASGEGAVNGTHNGLNFVNGKPDTPMAENLERFDEWGGAKVHGNYSAAWALAGNTPFNYYKQTLYGGGVIDPLVVAWPKGIQDQGGLRSQFHHIIDVMPTLLEAAGVKAPQVVDGVEQQPIDGLSMAYTFEESDTPTQKSVQYFEMNGNRAIWADGWKAISLYQPRPWNLLVDRRDPTDTPWALYHVAEDFNERIDLADKHPRKLAELKDLFEAEAKRNNVYPLLPSTRERPAMLAAQIAEERNNRWVLYPPGASRLPEVLAPPTKNRSHTITAEVVIPEQGAEGVLVTQGGRQGGYALYLQDGQLVYGYNYLDEALYMLRSEQPLAAGPAIVRLEFESTGQHQGHARLFVNDRQVAEGDIPKTVPAMFGLTDMFEVGRDSGTSINDDYVPPFAFTGELERVVVEVEDK